MKTPKRPVPKTPPPPPASREAAALALLERVLAVTQAEEFTALKAEIATFLGDV